MNSVCNAFNASAYAFHELKKSDCKGELKVTSGIIYAYMHKIGSNGFPAQDKIKSIAHTDESESSKLILKKIVGMRNG